MVVLPFWFLFKNHGKRAGVTSKNKIHPIPDRGSNAVSTKQQQQPSTDTGKTVGSLAASKTLRRCGYPKHLESQLVSTQFQFGSCCRADAPETERSKGSVLLFGPLPWGTCYTLPNDSCVQAKKELTGNRSQSIASRNLLEGTASADRTSCSSVTWCP